jgi:predicted transcriptional regulator
MHERNKIDFIAEVSEGLVDVEAGRVIKTEELMERLSSWRSLGNGTKRAIKQMLS